MYGFYQVPSFLAAAMLLAVLLRARRRLKLPLTLTLAPLGLLIGSLFTLAQDFIGPERLQALLLAAFPDANDPNDYQETGYMIDGVETGNVYMALLYISYFLQAVAWIMLGIGLIQFGNRRAKERHFAQFTEPSHERIAD